MTGKTISTEITHTVTLGSGSYLSPLTIMSTGAIAPATAGANGIYVPNLATLARISNSGLIAGATGGTVEYAGSLGGTAIILNSAAVLTNAGRIVAGSGGSTDTGGNGGVGVLVSAASTIVNSGYIAGGSGGYGHYSSGAGGVGIELATASTLTNSGTIRGGGGGYSYSYVSGSADGSAAAAIIGSQEDVITNTGIIIGGSGAATANYVRAGAQGVALTYGGTLTNSGRITGGNGAGEADARKGGLGGDGIDIDASSATNSGIIIGGVGGYGSYGGTGGAGASVSDYGIFTNKDLIEGGGGGGGADGGPTGARGIGGQVPGGDIGGNGVDMASYATVTNSYRIVGGVGGSDGTSGQGSGDGGNGVSMTSGMLTNHGSITGGAGGIGNGAQSTGNSLVSSGDGGDGVFAYSIIGAQVPSIANYGLIAGGAAGVFNGTSGTAGVGGAGLYISTDGFGQYGAVGTISNSGTIRGGAGGNASQNSSADGFGGAGGAGFFSTGPVDLINSSTIIAGAGGTGAGAGGAGGTGVSISNTFIVNGGIVDAIGFGTLTNTGRITGGSAGANGGPGGAGVIIGGVLANSGAITGGAASGSSGVGGAGAVITGAAFTNSGTISGSTASGSNGIGGAGAVFAGTMFTDTGTINGGAASGKGGVGGVGVYITGGTFLDSGLIKGGAGATQGDAIVMNFGTLELNAAASVSGIIESYEYSNSLELLGTSATTLTGFGTEIIGFGNISFASGAQRIIEGASSDDGLGGAQIYGFAAHDIIVLDGYTADLADTTIGTPDIDLFDGTNYVSLDLQYRLARDLILSTAGGKTTLNAAVGTVSHVLSATAEQFVLAGGLATGTTIDTNGIEEIYNGGTAAATTIAGGKLELQVGAKVTGGISFSAVKGGKLVLKSAIMPTATISGFISGDSITLAGIAYNSHDTVTVKTAGIVSIIAPETTYNLNIAGATVGETGFKFAAGSVLTTAATAAASPAMMSFLSPVQSLYALGPARIEAFWTDDAFPFSGDYDARPTFTPTGASQRASVPPQALPAFLDGHAMWLSGHAPLVFIGSTH